MFPEMYLPLLVMVLGFYLLFLVLLFCGCGSVYCRLNAAVAGLAIR